MQHTNNVRTCAAAIAGAIERHEHEHDQRRLGAAIECALRPLLADPDLLSHGIPRQGNNVAQSWHLYYDGEMSILLFAVPKGQTIPPHDHGIWETLSVYRGRVQHVVYERMDDGSVPGSAELRALDERVLEVGHFVIVAPPADIHSFTGLDDDTYAVTVVSGAYKAERHYYQPEQKTYVVRKQRNAH